MTKRDLAQEILNGISEIKAEQGRHFVIETPDDISAIRKDMHLTQSAFAALMGISVRTLQEWEQGRRHPHGSANSLLKIARICPLFSRLHKISGWDFKMIFELEETRKKLSTSLINIRPYQNNA